MPLDPVGPLWHDRAVPRNQRSVLLDISPFRASKHFTWMWFGALVTGIGNSLTAVAVGLHVYALTHSTFAVSLVGVVALVPTVIAGLYGGTIVDRHDRRRVALLAACLAWASTAAIAALSWAGMETVWTLYLLSALNPVGASLVSAARNAIIPNLIPAETLPAAGALNGISMGLVVTVGPSLAGLLVGRWGFSWAYTLDLLLFCGAFLGLAALPALPPRGTVHDDTWGAIKESFAFVRGNRVVAMSFAVDLVAMTFGNPRSLYPALGAVVIGGGATTAGLLASSQAVGALVCGLFSGRVVHWRRHGRAVNWSVALYGLFCVGLGLVVWSVHVGRWPGGVGTLQEVNSSAMVAAMVMLAGMGASDNVSSIFRNTILAEAVPDSLRGRMQGIFIMVVTGGPRLGDAFVGVVALAAVWAPSLLGGLAICVLVGVLARLVPDFHCYAAGPVSSD